MSCINIIQREAERRRLDRSLNYNPPGFFSRDKKTGRTYDRPSYDRPSYIIQLLNPEADTEGKNGRMVIQDITSASWQSRESLGLSCFHTFSSGLSMFFFSVSMSSIIPIQPELSGSKNSRNTPDAVVSNAAVDAADDASAVINELLSSLGAISDKKQASVRLSSCSCS